MGMSAAQRLESWKEIAAYFRRGVRTVQRWEREEGLPVHRHQHDKLGSIYAYPSELDAWSQARQAKHVNWLRVTLIAGVATARRLPGACRMPNRSLTAGT